MKSRELQFPGMREATLHAHAWLPDGEPRAVVVISHGLGLSALPWVAALVPASAFMVALWSLALDRASTPQDSQHAGECA